MAQQPCPECGMSGAAHRPDCKRLSALPIEEVNLHLEHLLGERDEEIRKLNRKVHEVWELLDSEPSGPGEGLVSQFGEAAAQSEWADRYRALKAKHGISEKPAVPAQKDEWCVCGDSKRAHSQLPCTVLKPDGPGFYDPKRPYDMKLKPCGCTEFRQQVPEHLCLPCAKKLNARVSAKWTHAGRCCLCEQDGALYKKQV